MKRELFIHFSFWFSFFVLIALLKQYFNISYWPFWAGGILGIILPDLDHLIYVLFLKPQELTSLRFRFLLGRKDLKRSVSLLYETRSERSSLIFHSFFFQVIFLALTFWMVSSSGSLFGRGLVLSFALHLLIDQLMDLTDLKHLDNWKNIFPINFRLKTAKIYLGLSFLLLCIFGLLL
jgi:hypothetical protein